VWECGEGQTAMPHAKCKNADHRLQSNSEVGETSYGTVAEKKDPETINKQQPAEIHVGLKLL